MSRPGRNTSLVADARGSLFAVTRAQLRIVERAMNVDGGVFVTGREVSAARKLETIGIGTLTDDGKMTTFRGRSDGERWWFKLARDVAIVQRSSIQGDRRLRGQP